MTGTDVRTLVLDALDEMNYWEQANDGLEPDEDPVTRPSPDLREYDEWKHYIDSLATEVLEDYDFDMADELLDAPPERAAAMKAQLNIMPDYCTAVPADPEPDETVRIKRELLTYLSQWTGN